MTLTAGSRLGPYEIVAALGAGGMGEVYRARDTKLGRDVAIKILSEAFVADPERAARFEREAQLLAALNHPHIGAIYGLEETRATGSEQASATTFLVLELVDGESLARRLEGAKGSGLGIAESLGLATQIVDALEAAHEKGIIHRDLKPANVMLTADGQVKVLDFGLAKVMESVAAAGPGGLTHSPTLTFAATEAGVILGTASYMSPEQARGRAADKRSDIWAFGCVLFEMLSGTRAFDGENVADVIAAVMRGEPDWSLLPSHVPPYVRALVERCLEKDRKARLGDFAVVRYIMTEGEAARTPVAGVGAAAGAAGALRLRPIVLVAAGLAIAAVATAATWLATRPQPELRRLARFGMTPTANLGGPPPDRNLVISPDGTHVVYIGTNGDLLVRALDQLDAVAVPGVTNARSPFISPDSQWIGYFTTAGEMRKVSIGGGAPITLCRFAGPPRGGTWGSDGTIVFATADPATGLLAVPAAGGEPKVLTKPDAAHGEGDHILPSMLPGDRAVLYTITPEGPVSSAQIAVLDLDSNQHRVLIRGGSQSEYVSSGHLVYGAAGTLRAVRFDLRRLEVANDPIPVVDNVAMGASGAANFSIARTGTLVYAPGGGAEGNSLVWLDRQGHEEMIPAPPRAYSLARISPDGSRVALEIRDQELDIWIWEFARQTLTRLTVDAALDSNPLWTPDGRRVIFASGRDGQMNVFWQPADGIGPAERLTKSLNLQLPQSMTPEGSRLVFRETTATTSATDLGLLTLDAKRELQPLLQAPMSQLNAEVSPDGRWLAYQSDESGRPEIYVRPFPNVNDGRWQISTSGGTRPLWARSGRELFYLNISTMLMSAAITATTTTTFGVATAVKLFDTRILNPLAHRAYDVSPDGKRFLLIKPARDPDSRSGTPSMIVVLNWLEELKTRVPSK